MDWKTYHPEGPLRVIVTKELPGERWLAALTEAGCRVDVCQLSHALTIPEIKAAIGDRCDGAIGQLTEPWGHELFSALKAAGGRAYSNYAVGFNNVDLAAATALGMPVGNTPGVLTETTAEMAVTLALAAGRRVVEADRFMREGKFKTWLPDMFLGQRFWRKTVGVIGAGRIGAAFGRMMVEAFRMNMVYYDLNPNLGLESYISAYAAFLESMGEAPVFAYRAESVEQVLEEADVVSLHTVLDETTRHLINAQRLSLMKPDAILVNTSRGPVVDEAALVAHCQTHPEFKAGLDVFEDEPVMKPGLAELPNVVIPPHIASGTVWTRAGMATLAASNVAAILRGDPVWPKDDILPFLGEDPPRAAPSILNAKALGLAFLKI